MGFCLEGYKMPFRIKNELYMFDADSILEEIKGGKRVEIIPAKNMKEPILRIGRKHGLLVKFCDDSYYMDIFIYFNCSKEDKWDIVEECIKNLEKEYVVKVCKDNYFIEMPDLLSYSFAYKLSFKNQMSFMDWDFDPTSLYSAHICVDKARRLNKREGDGFIYFLMDIDEIIRIIEIVVNSIYNASGIDYTGKIQTHHRVVDEVNDEIIDYFECEDVKEITLKDPPYEEQGDYYDIKQQKMIMERVKNTFLVKKPSITFNQIGGCEEAKESLILLKIGLKNPSVFKKWGVRLPRGIILYGPPGTGKTLLIKALAHEANVPFFSVNIGDIESKWVGESEKYINTLFDYAEVNAPSIIHFDEIDSVCPHRSNSSEYTQKDVSIILQRMDGFKTTDKVIVIGTTNYIENIDKALLRPGRFDKLIEIPLPDKMAREEIFKIHCKGKRIGDIDYELLAEESEGLSGADIEAIIQFSLEMKLKEEVFTHKEPKPVLTEDILYSIDQFKRNRGIIDNKPQNQIYI